jgi:hypothetical protein
LSDFVKDPNIQKEFYVPRNSLKTNIPPMWASMYTKALAQVYTEEQILAFLKDPRVNYQKLQGVSEYLYNTSKLYQNFLYYLSTIMTFDYTVFPDTDVDSIKKDTLWTRFEKSAKQVYNIQPEYNFPLMLMRTLLNGETYWYNVSTENAEIFYEIPSKYCQAAGYDSNNLWRYWINLSLIDPNLVSELPVEIQEKYNEYKDKKNKTADDNFYLVSERGFAIFCHGRNETHDYPYFSSMFIDLNRLESDKDYFNNFIKADNIKLIHCKVPIDEKTGLPKMEKSEVRDYYDSLKEHVPDNIAPIMNPFETEGINLDSAQKTSINIVEVAKKNVQDDSGISDSMFAADTTMGLKYSTLADASAMYPLLIYFENFVNFKIKENRFKCKFLRLNQHDKLEWNKQFANGMSTSGDVRSKYIATSQTGLYEFIMTSKMEQALDFDSLMPIKESAYQQSGKQEEGRPETDEPAESTEKVNARK